MITLFYILLAALGLGILVFIHELGHYIVAKKVGMTVEVFSIGFGKPIFKWRWHNVDWQVGILPFGGYVRIKGMELTKKDKNTYIEPHEVPNGFFAHPPYKRILVALAGPVANFILAFLIFALLWGMGGRQKNFAEFTHVIGWVDPKSEIYALGVRPGDILEKYDGKPYTNAKDLIYAAMLGDKKVELSGKHVDYKTGEKRPFSYRVETYPNPAAVDGILTTGIASGARYLVYDRYLNGAENPFPEGSPMVESGIQYGDRLVWADGETLFSMDQLSYIANKEQAFLTVKRGDEMFQTRQPRVKAGDLLLPTLVRNEILDWQYEANIKGRYQDLYILPYNLSADATVEGDLSFIDEESKKEAFPLHPYSAELERPLRAGDKIIAIDGVPINTAYQLLDLIQTHHVLLLVERGQKHQIVTTENQDALFEKEIHPQEMEQVTKTIGTPNALKQSGSYVLLNPIQPKRYAEFNLSSEAEAKMQEEIKKQRKVIEEIKDQNKRTKALAYFNEVTNRQMIGLYLQDEQVNYNPGPFTMFKNIFIETAQTLKALLTGYLNPKWISGPIGIVQVMHHGWQVGIGEALFWIGVISLNLGVLNLLPIPVLDGGYICLSLWEMITRKRIKARVLERLIIPFVIILIGLIIFLTFQDITRLF